MHPNWTQGEFFAKFWKIKNKYLTLQQNKK